jgi:hypothetical protein
MIMGVDDQPDDQELLRRKSFCRLVLLYKKVARSSIRDTQDAVSSISREFTASSAVSHWLPEAQLTME